jgi:hypothetical protein
MILGSVSAGVYILVWHSLEIYKGKRRTVAACGPKGKYRGDPKKDELLRVATTQCARVGRVSHYYRIGQTSPKQMPLQQKT